MKADFTDSRELLHDDEYSREEVEDTLDTLQSVVVDAAREEHRVALQP